MDTSDFRGYNCLNMNWRQLKKILITCCAQNGFKAQVTESQQHFYLNTNGNTRLPLPRLLPCRPGPPLPRAKPSASPLGVAFLTSTCSREKTPRVIESNTTYQLCTCNRSRGNSEKSKQVAWSCENWKPYKFQLSVKSMNRKTCERCQGNSLQASQEMPLILQNSLQAGKVIHIGRGKPLTVDQEYFID